MRMLKNAGSDGAAGPQTAGPHNLILEDRAQMTATGVLRMIRCDETEASMETSRGTLTVQGRGLSVSALSIETGEVHRHRAGGRHRIHGKPRLGRGLLAPADPLMPPSVAPAQAGLDALQCMGLGLLAGAVRCCLPRRRAGAFCADFLLAVLTLLALQSFSACRSAQGVLRWYMLGGAAAGAAAGEALLRAGAGAVLSRALQERVAAPLCRAGRFLLRPLQNARTARKTAQKSIKMAGNLTRQSKKRLQNRAPELLYNSNVSIECGDCLNGAHRYKIQAERGRG
jgi:hypothetical protein